MVASTGLTAALLAAGTAPAAANGCAESFSGGTGTAPTPFLISVAADLTALQGDDRCWGYDFQQTADISMGGATWTSDIGNSVTKFTGTFDGGGHEISGLNISSANPQVGLFGELGTNGALSNVGFTGNVTGGAGAAVGGLVGLNRGSVSRSYATGTVVGGDSAYVGGLVGVNFGSLSSSYSTGAVAGGDSSVVGGGVGVIDSSPLGVVSNSYATGQVTGGDSSSVGGFIGNHNGSVSDSYSTGTVVGGTAAVMGGLVGVKSGTASATFWDTDSSGTITGVGSGTSTEVTGKTTAQMRTLATFTVANWSIAEAATSTTSWGICSGVSYPYLVWQYSSDPCSSGTTPRSGQSFTFTFNASTGGQCFTWTVNPGPVTLPNTSVACTPEGTELVGWTIPGQAAAFSDGGTVIASGDQTFTAVAKNSTIDVTYDANVGNDTACIKDGVDTANRTTTTTVARDGVLTQAPPCAAAGVQFAGWTDQPTTDGPSTPVPGAAVFAGGDKVPNTWSVDPNVVNRIRLYAMWR